MSSGQLVKQSDQRVSYRALLEQNKGSFAQALPQHIGVERFIRVALTAAVQNPNLLRCTKESIMAALLQSAQLGLVPDGLLGQAFVIPYGEKATFQVGAQGLCELATRTGRISAVIPDVVHEKDIFEFWRDVEQDHFKHIPHSGADDPGKVTHAYCIVRRTDKTAKVEVLSVGKIEREHRAHSKARNSGPWQTHYEAMCKKTAVLVALKWESKSPELARALAVEEKVDMGLDIPQEQEAILDAETIPQPSALDKLAGNTPAGSPIDKSSAAMRYDESSNVAPCAGCACNVPAPSVSDAEGRAFHNECLAVLKKK
jgi:recombination protein RecT